MLRHVWMPGEQGLWAGHVGSSWVAPPPLDLTGDDRLDLPRVTNEHEARREAGNLVEPIIRQLVRLVHYQQCEGGYPAVVYPGPSRSIRHHDAGASGKLSRRSGHLYTGEER